MDKDEIEKSKQELNHTAFFWWIRSQDGTVETNCPSTPSPPIQKKIVEEPEPPIPPKPIYKKLTCKRCNYSWTPRKKQKPVQCPKCKSPYWNREKVKRK
jgi:hypothetical protein